MTHRPLHPTPWSVSEGPWDIGIGAGCVYSVLDAEGRLISVFEDDPGPAYLIAAAPNLLAALKDARDALLRQWFVFGDPISTPQWAREMLSTLNAAIAQAEPPK